MPNKGFECTGTWGATPRQPAGHFGKWTNWANVLGQPPTKLRGVAPGSAGLGLGLAARKRPCATPPKVDGTGT